VCPHRLGNLLPHAHRGIQRGHGLLKDHRDPRSAQPPHGLRIQRQKIDWRRPIRGKRYFAADRCFRREQPHDGQRSHRFSRSRLANQSEHFAALELKADIADGRDLTRRRGKSHAQIADLNRHREMLAADRFSPGTTPNSPHSDFDMMGLTTSPSIEPYLRRRRGLHRPEKGEQASAAALPCLVMTIGSRVLVA
jgi:hypothetical protein